METEPRDHQNPLFFRLTEEASMSVPMEEEDEDDEVWDMGRKPLKTVQDILDYWDHRLEKVNFIFKRFGI
jgi:hypothetical protein